MVAAPRPMVGYNSIFGHWCITCAVHMKLTHSFFPFFLSKYLFGRSFCNHPAWAQDTCTRIAKTTAGLESVNNTGVASAHHQSGCITQTGINACIAPSGASPKRVHRQSGCITQTGASPKRVHHPNGCITQTGASPERVHPNGCITQARRPY